MTNVLIVGFGNIGLRHCESLIKFNKIKKIFIYDINYKKLQSFKKGINSKNKNKIVILKDLNKNKENFFLSIISTNSNVRFNVFKKIVNTFNIKYFIFEKIVFQKTNEFDLAKEIIKIKKLKCWINCPRRTWSIFKSLKKNIIKNKKTSISISGKKWGILSNSIHFVDLFIYLTGRKNLKFELNNLNKKFYETKRKGFFETSGVIKVTNNFNDKLILRDDYRLDKNKFIFKFYQKNKYFYYDQNDIRNKFKAPYQSSETIKHVKNILRNGSCNLPSYLRTYKIHKLFSESIYEFQKENKKKILFT